MFRAVAWALAWLSLLAHPAAGQSDYPTRPVRIIVPSSPGGGTDILARVLADQLARSLGGQFIVENRPGAGQMIGIEQVARAAPDGTTLLMAASTLAINPVMYRKVSYDAVRDFAPITLVASLPNVLVVHPSLPVQTLPALIALAKERPGQLTYASAGIGTSPHMGMELLKSMAGIDLVHIPFRGTGPAVTEILSGRVPMGLSNTITALPHIEGRTLRALAVTGARRAAVLPDVPTVAESGVPGYEAMQWYGMLAPTGTSPDIVARLQQEIAKALNLPEVREKLAADGAEPVGSSAAEFAALIKNELEKWAMVARTAHIEPQ